MIDPGPIVSLLAEKQAEVLLLREQIQVLQQRIAELEEQVPKPGQ